MTDAGRVSDIEALLRTFSIVSEQEEHGVDDYDGSTSEVQQSDHGVQIAKRRVLLVQ